jgi:hypothetical protein
MRQDWARAEFIHVGQRVGELMKRALLPIVPPLQVTTRLIGFFQCPVAGVAQKPSSRALTQTTYCNADWVSFTAQ